MARSIIIKPKDTIYLVMGDDPCKENNHHFESIRGMMKFKSGDHHMIDCRYCTKCAQYQINRNEFARIQTQFGQADVNVFIPGLDDAEWMESEPAETACEFYQRADVSKLKQLGYSVSKDAGLSDEHRQQLLKDSIKNGFVTKYEAINHISSLIRINGKRSVNADSLQKWQADLDFLWRL